MLELAVELSTATKHTGRPKAAGARPAATGSTYSPAAFLRLGARAFFAAGFLVLAAISIR